MARQGYSDEVKAAVMAALLAGQSSSQIAATYHIPQTTIRAWKSRQHNGEGVATVTTEKKTRIGDMLIDLLETEIETLKHLSIAARDERWLKLQHAEGMAVFSGVKYDKVARILEAFGKDDSDDPPAQD